MDIVGRLHLPKDGGPGLFFNGNDAPNTASLYDLETDYLPIDEVVANWAKIIDWVRDQQKGTKVVFLNFPLDTYPNPKVAARAIELSKSLTSKRIKIIPLLPIHPTMWRDKTHFLFPQYAMYAAYVRTITRMKKANEIEDGGDDILISAST